MTTHSAACYGIGCPRHADCELYAMVERSSADDTIGTCDWAGDGVRPMFTPAQASAEANHVERAALREAA